MAYLCHPFLFILLLNISPLYAKFNFNQKEVQEAYKNILKLKVDVAKAQLIALNDTSQHKKNGIVPLLENYLDIISLLTTEDKELYKKLKPNEHLRIKEVRNNEVNSPYYLYAQADIRLQWAFVELIFEDYVNGFLDLKRANDLIDDNIEKYPNFKLNNKVKGLIDLLTEASPEEANLALFAAGLTRSENGSQKLIETSIQEPFFKTEIDIYLSFVNAYIKNDATSGMWKIEKTYKDHKDNLFALFTYANILSKLKMHQNLLILLKENPLHRKQGYLYIPYLDYLWGETELNLLQYQKSVETFKTFIKNTNNNKTFCASACFNIALVYSSKKQSDSVLKYLQFIPLFPKNDLYLDQYALHFVQNKIKLDPTLSLGRLMCDGASYQTCFDLLIKTPDYRSNEFNVEKNYRLGLCMRQLGKYDECVKYFIKCVEQSNLTDYNFYAPFAALQLGYHFQEKDDLINAIKYYKKAKSYKNHFYYASVKEKADLKLKTIEK